MDLDSKLILNNLEWEEEVEDNQWNNLLKKQYDHIWKKIRNYMIQIIKTTRQKNEKGGNGGSVFIENKEGRS